MTDHVIDDARTTGLTLAQGDTALITASGSIIADGMAISSNGVDTSIDVLGTVRSQGNIGFLGLGLSSASIGLTGTVAGVTAIQFEQAGAKLVENFGTVSGSRNGIVNLGPNPLTVVNTGLIEGGSLGDGNAILCTNAADDAVINEGVIRGGLVNLGGGRDTYYGRNGSAPGTGIDLGADDDRAFGGAGQEIFIGGLGNDVLDGGAGADTVVYNPLDSSGNFVIDLRISGPQETGNGRDTLIDIENVTVLAGNYSLFGNSLANVLAGGSGQDTLTGGTGNDTFFGGPGNDLFDGGADIDVVTFEAPYLSSLLFPQTTGATVDLASASPQATGYGTDLFIGIEGLIGTSLADRFTGSGAANTFWGRGGNDTLDGAGGNDTLVQEAGDGDDALIGGAGLDTVSFSGAAGAVVNLALTAAQSTAYGADVYSGIENLSGGSGNDRFTGNSAANALKGNAGNDTLDGGTGRDALSGGDGRDTFVFRDRPVAANVDTIRDYSLADDTIQLDNKYMAGLGGPGRLSSAKFFAGHAAHDASDRVIYDRTTGKLFYDPDGTGPAAQQLVAILTNKAVLDAGEFIII